MKDAAASVRARLLNHARTRRLEFQSVLTRYGIERLLYRLSISPHAQGFVLKGAQLLVVHAVEPHRPTKDLDLLGFGSDHASDVAQVFRKVSAVAVEPDGLVFDAGSVTAEGIRETARYAGVRVKLTATLERARIPLQVDAGFGDGPPPAPCTSIPSSGATSSSCTSSAISQLESLRELAGQGFLTPPAPAS